MTPGFNYGSGSIIYTASYNSSRVAADLADMQRLSGPGSTVHIRVTFPTYNATAVHIANAKLVCLSAKALGFYVVWGVSSVGNTLTSTTYAAWKTEADARALWCSQNNIDEFSYGNEEELRVDNTTLPYATFRSQMKTDAGAAKVLYPTVKFTYSVDASSYQGYINEGIGTLDYLSLNDYGFNTPAHSLFDLGTFRLKAKDVISAFGAKAYISEYNMYSTWSYVAPLSQDDRARHLGTRRRMLKDLGAARAYFFTYSNQSSDDFALMLGSGDYSPMVAVATGRRAWFTGVPNVVISRSANPSRTATPSRGITPTRGTI